jgi:nitroreductase
MKSFNNSVVVNSSMDTLECIATKFDIRQFSNEQVPNEVKTKILEAARFTGTGLNTQHWRFILIDKKESLATLARDSTSGGWVSGANFAIIVLTEPRHKFHMLDAGRALQDMQLAAWNLGVASGLFTGIIEESLRKHFSIPANLTPTVVLGFGYPLRKQTGARKNRKPLTDVVFYEKYGSPIGSQ